MHQLITDLGSVVHKSWLVVSWMFLLLGVILGLYVSSCMILLVYWDFYHILAQSSMPISWTNIEKVFGCWVFVGVGDILWFVVLLVQCWTNVLFCICPHQVRILHQITSLSFSLCNSFFHVISQFFFYAILYMPSSNQ